MARVHLFTSHHSGDQKHHQPDKAFASLSAQEQSTIAHTHKEASDEPHTLDVTAVASPNLTDDQAEEKSKKLQQKESIPLPPTSSAALAAALLQNQTSIDVVETLTAALAAKKGAAEAKDDDDKSAAKDAKATEGTKGKGKGKESEAFEQEDAATALQLLGLSQSDSQKSQTAADDSKTKSATTATTDSGNENLDVTDAMLLANIPGLTNNEAMELNEEHSESDTEDAKTGEWTKEEDDLLLQGIKRLGYGKWKEIAISIPGRKSKQLKHRWDHTLAAKFVDQELLHSKLKESNNQDQVMQESTAQEEQPAATTAADNKTLKLLDTEWSELAQKLSERLRASQAEGAEQSLSLLNDVANQLARSSQSLSFPDAAALAMYAQQLHAGQQEPVDGADNHGSIAGQYYLPNPFGGAGPNESAINAAAAAVAAVASASSTSNAGGLDQAGLKRKHAESTLAQTQADAIDYYASAQPVTTTVNNETHTVYPCLYPGCTKTFMRLYNLKSHSRTHTDDRPFKCTVCSQAFSRNHDLKRHVKIHAGGKPFHCPACGKMFSRLDALKRHKANQRNRCD
ncbi:hypothetical protein INT43_001535 [Umbelopsis isabellina]|uniref:Uncharacterized protein n=1 Tax=Mortierella isabellina TaxID=91625 RepID=A0A8H7U9T1_MORIS|nr:hypothetical protein INT43_001535 [Umbelopsis isabellina]